MPKPIKPSPAKFISPWTGRPVTPMVGRTVGISVPLKNTGSFKEKFTVIMIVRDVKGVVRSIQWQTIVLPGGESGEVGFTFVPPEPGDYKVEVYIIESLTTWTPKGETYTTTMHVVSAS